MGTITEEFVNEAKDYILMLLNHGLSEKLQYHNSRHTLDVLNYSEIIGSQSRLDKASFNLLRLSALFHDVGYIDKYKGHEEVSAAYAKDYLQSKGVNDDDITQVERAIISTRIPQQPKDIVSEILCDADLMYLADQSSYFEDAELLRREWSDVNIIKLSEPEFLRVSLDFFDNHQYFTKFGKNILSKKKELNRERIIKKVEGRH